MTATQRRYIDEAVEALEDGAAAGRGERDDWIRRIVNSSPASMDSCRLGLTENAIETAIKHLRLVIEIEEREEAHG